MPKRIKDLEELRRLATREDGGFLTVALELKHGAYSKKDVLWEPERGLWHVYHHIDGVYGTYDDAKLAAETNVTKGLENGALWALED
jgi:hypothetical protein